MKKNVTSKRQAWRKVQGFYEFSRGGDDGEFLIVLRGDGTCSYFKECDSDYDKPMCPFGTSYIGNGHFEVKDDSIIYSGTGHGMDYGWMY